jgi:hypothetical protein
MPSDEKEFEDMASSAGPEDVTDTAPAVEEPAKSSDATQSENGDSDLLSVVRDVVTKDKQPADPPASQAEGEEAEGAGETAEPDDENFSDVPFNKHPRFRKLLAERNAFKNDAQLYRNVQTFIDEQGLTAEETADGLVIMGLAKTNPAEAWKQIKPWVQSLLVASGEVLPDDLKGMVQKGEISPQAALEVSRNRASVQSMQVQRQVEQQRADQQRQRNASTALRTTAADWEADRRLKDPNFDAKYEPLMDRVYALQRREGVPNTPAGVRDQLDRAYKGLVAPAAAAPAIAPKPPVAPVRPGQVAGNQAPAAQSTMDIIKARMGARG